jgi:hypothetical protein
MIEGDSKEYEVFEEAIKQLTNPIGATVEIGVRRGMGSKMIIDRKKSVSRGQPELYPGSMVLDLANREPCSPIAETWPMIQKIFDSLITKSR